jgi:acyl-CoA synthetase (AMP-forming)/AMP-acid ligase II
LWARETSDACALTQGVEELSYAELAAQTEALAGRLAAAGVARGERAVVAAENCVEWVVGFLAVLRVGGIVVPLNTRLGEIEIARQVEACAPKLVLATESFVPALEAAASPQTVLALERGRSPRSVWALPAGELPPSPSGKDDALIAFTSGTTGEPKGALVSHEALARSAGAFPPVLETGSGDTTLIMVPLFHNTGFVDQLSHMLLVGGAVDLIPEYHTETALAALTRRPASYLIAVPSIYRLLMLDEQAGTAFAGCRTAVYGGSAMPAAWAEELGRRWPHLRLFNCYGLTEFTSVSHLLCPEEAIEHGVTVGRPVAGVSQLIAGEDERPSPPGQPGEVWLSGPMRMRGYWRSPAETEAAFRGEWLRTGDFGTLDDEGFLTVLGRSAEVINRGGEKVYATQVEAALSHVEAVAEAAVVGAPHPILQERIVACVALRPGYELDEDDARASIAPYLPDYALPERFVIVDELPRNAAGKLDRARLKETMDEPAGQAA